MRMNKKWYAALLLLFSVQLLSAQTFTLEQAIDRALDENRDIQIAVKEIEKANAAVSEAFGYALPSLDISANFSHFLEKPKMSFPDFGAMLNNATYSVLFDEGILPQDNSKFQPLGYSLQTFAQENNYQAQAQLTQILFNSAVLDGIGASKVYLNLSKEQLKGTISKTVLDVTKAFNGVLLAKDLLQITRDRMANAEEHLSTLKSMRKQGLLSDYEEMQAEIQVANIRPVLLQMENILQDATNGLKILLNIPQDNDMTIVGKLNYDSTATMPAQDLVTQALNKNFTLSALRVKRQLDDALVSVDRGGYWPTLAAFGSYTYAGSGEGWDLQNYKSSTVGLSLSINLFQGGRTANKVEQDQIVAKQTDRQIATLEDATSMQIKSKLQEIQRVQKLISVMERNIALAQKAYDIAEHRYEEGLGSELELKDADVALSQARTNYTNAVHDYLNARAEVDNLTGMLAPHYIKRFEKVLEN